MNSSLYNAASSPIAWDRGSVILFSGIVVLLSIAGVAYLPYSAAAVIGALFGFLLLVSRPDLAFMLFFGVENLFSEDILLVTEELEQTIFKISLPYIGLNAFEVALAALVVATLLQRRGRIFGTMLDYSIAFFALMCVIGYITGIVLYGDPSRIFEPRRLLHFFISYYLFVNLIRTKESLQLFLFVFLFAIVLKSLEGVMLYVMGSGLLIKWRIRAIFTGWEDSLSFLTYLFILANFLLDRRDFPGKRLFLLFTPTVFFCFLFSYKRAYYIAFVAGLFILFLLQKSKAKVRFLFLMIAASIIMMGVITAAGQWQAIGMRVSSIFEPTKESSAHYRIIEWRNAFISIHRHPLFGIGLGGIMPMEIFLPRTNLLGVHNTYIWTAVKMGFFGFFSYLLIKFCFLRQLIRQNTRLQDPFLQTLSKGLTCSFIAFSTAEMFAPMFTQMRTATWLGIILGMGMLLGKMDLEERDKKISPSKHGH